MEKWDDRREKVSNKIIQDNSKGLKDMNLQDGSLLSVQHSVKCRNTGKDIIKMSQKCKEKILIASRAKRVIIINEDCFHLKWS